MSGIQGVFRSLDTSGSALTAQRYRMEVISNNLAYSDVDSTNGGGAYKRRRVAFHTILDRAMGPGKSGVPYTGVRASIRIDDSPGPTEQAPAGMDWGIGGVDEEGKIEKSNVDVNEEMVQLLEASRAYEANVAAVKAFREMVSRALTIGG